MTNALKKYHISSLFWLCLLASISLHLIGLLTFYHHPLILHSYFSSFFGTNTPDPLALEEDPLADKNREIEEAFSSILILSPQLQQPFDLAKTPQGIALCPQREEPQESTPISSEQGPAISFSEAESLAEAEPIHLSESPLPTPLITIEDTPSTTLPQIELDTHFATNAILPLLQVSIPQENGAADETPLLPSDIALAARPETIVDGVALSKKIEFLAQEDKESIAEIKPELPEPLLKPRIESRITTTPDSQKLTLHVSKSSVLPPASWENSREAPPLLPPIEDYALPKLASATAWNDDFDVHLRLSSKKEEGEGYNFSISVQPRFDLQTEALKQNFYFLIDRSSSIEKHRFSLFKRAVLKALASMQDGDTFNIYLFDKKIVRLSEKSLPYNLKTLQKAEDFLEKQEHRGFLASADIYHNIEQVLPQIPYDDEVHTAILITDGNTLLAPSKQQKWLNKWVEDNHGKLDLYTAAAAQNNNLLLLDLLGTVSGGKLIYSDTNTSFPRKLAKLILTLREPLAKEIMVSVVPSDPNTQIELYPQTQHLPSLYTHQPYTVYGSINDPSSFEIVIQGRHGDQWIAIRKSISFTDAEKGDHLMQKRCTAREATQYYDKFLREGKVAHLKEAEKLFKQAGHEGSFE
jgi:hypothetical protein